MRPSAYWLLSSEGHIGHLPFVSMYEGGGVYKGTKEPSNMYMRLLAMNLTKDIVTLIWLLACLWRHPWQL